jgi:uncharacterized protein (TIGR01777 family)
MRGRVLVTGATGFVGRAVVRVLLREGYDVTAWARDARWAGVLLGADVTVASGGDDALVAAVDGAVGVVNLAGEPILAGRWTRSRRERIVNSRVDTTRRLVAAIEASKQRPTVLVSASAVGFYGDRADAPCTEDTPGGTGFLAEVCAAWEAAAAPARALGVRVATPRIGVVLGPEEGALASLVPLFRAGLGGRIGGGDQPFPWIHVDDLAELIVRAVGDVAVDGPFNAVAGSVPQRLFATSLASALGRPAFAPTPGFALRALYGDGATLLLDGQNVVPTRAWGATPRFGSLDEALRDALDATSVEIGPAADVPDHDYLRARPPRRRLRQVTRLRGAPSDVVPFFEKPMNLGILMPPAMQFARKDEGPPEMRAGAVTDFDIRVGPVPLTWRLVMELWEPGRRFVDAAHRGPYASWWHEHRFEDGGGAVTVVNDTIWFASPLGPLGRVADALYVEPMLRRIFAYRRVASRQRFGLA